MSKRMPLARITGTPGRALSRLWRLAFGLLLAVGLTAVPQPAAAHSTDAYPRLTDAPAGPYRLSVWTAPATLRPGEAHFVVLVADGVDGRPVAPASVAVAVTSLATGEMVGRETAVRGTTPNEQFVYEANLRLAEPGHYRVTVSVGQPGQAEMVAAGFDVEVASGILLQVLIVLLCLQAIATAIWLIREGFTTWRPLPQPAS